MKFLKTLREHKKVVAAAVAAIALLAGLSSDKAKLIGEVASLGIELTGSN